VKKNFGRFIRNESGEIQVSLVEVRGEACLDLRIINRAAGHDESPPPKPQAISVPVRMLGDLYEILKQTREDLAKEELVERNPVMVLRGEQPGNHPDRPVPVRLPVECRLLSAPKSSPTKPTTEQVTGQTRDLSRGGAQVWLPEQFPVGCHLAVFMRTGELTFRAQAEVRGVASDPEHGHYRHNLKWMVLDSHARTALIQMMESTAHFPIPKAAS
jgi:hypothetical protein